MTITSGAGARKLGGWCFDRQTLRTRLPSFKWYVYAAALVNPGDGNTLTLRLRYVDNSGVSHTILTGAYTGASKQKVTLGPFDLFGTPAGFATNENVVVLEAEGQKSSGTDGDIKYVTTWMRYLPSRS